MTTIRLRNHFASDVTMISNEFIDNYMVSANGEYVKIYLYILRLTLDSSRSWTLSTITDKLECTSKDVLRALRYWTKKGLLSCEYNEAGELTSVAFLDPEDTREESEFLSSTPTAYLANSMHQTEARPSQPAAAVPVQSVLPYEKERTESICMAPDRVKKLKRSKDAKMILICAQGYLGHPLNQVETDTLLYFYDELHFSAELLDYLIEYCAAKEARNIAYIKKVGFAWYDAGITTVEQAREESTNHNRDYYAILRAYGLGSRDPGTQELEYMKKWLETDRMPADLVLEAVNRTMMQIHAPRFSYTDSILASWKQAGVASMADILALDEKHAQASKAAETVRRPSSSRSSKSGSFNDFESRDIDYASLERKLLGY